MDLGPHHDQSLLMGRQENRVFFRMKDRITDFLHYCKNIDFGKVELSRPESAFYKRFNNEIFTFCRSLPESAQTDAMLFFMRYSKVNLGGKLDFFSNYYPPTWSILYWLTHNGTLGAKRLKERDVASAITTQSMAMFLHSLDDHLTDHQLSVSPLTLLLRSQAWAIMNRACCDLAEGVSAVERSARGFIGEYYLSLQHLKESKSLDSYCDLFRRQMAIGMIAPTFLSLKMNGSSDFIKKIQSAYNSFGIAWRLLDDIKDIDSDIEKRSHSAIYVCLPKSVRTHWDRSRPAAKQPTNAILKHVLEKNLIDKIKERICAQLYIAASIVEAHNMTGLAQEFRCLAHPLRNGGSTLDENNGRPGVSLATR